MYSQPVSGKQIPVGLQLGDLLAQSQIEFQNSIANRKVIRGKAWRKDYLKSDTRYGYRPQKGYLIPAVPGGHKWAHYCSPQELQVWRDHILKDSLEEEGPLRCADLELWQDILTEVSTKPVIAKSLASVEGRKLLEELSPGAVLDGGSGSDQSTIRDMAWKGKSLGALSVGTSAQGRAITGLASPSVLHFRSP